MISHVTLLMFDQMLLSSLAMPLEMLDAARSHTVAKTRQRTPLTIESVLLTASESQRGNSMLSRMGLSLSGKTNLADVPHTDLILIPALWRHPRKSLLGLTQTNASDIEVLDWLKQRHKEGAIIMSIGTGVWLPAAAGLLSRQAATTHWHALDAFEQDFPEVKLTRDHLLTQAGSIYCAASINSGADLMIHLIGLFFDAETSNYVEQQFSPEARSAFDKRVFNDDAAQHADEAVALVQSWLHQHWTKPLSMALLAQKSNLGERQLARRFVRAVGVSPSRYLQTIRCQYAQDLLKNSDLSVADIAQHCGFSDSSHLGRVFRQFKGVSPGQYRTHVRAKLFSPDVSLSDV